MNLIDETTDTTDTDTYLTRVYRHGNDIIRVQVRRNFYPSQSFAAASILSTTRDWTTLLTTPISQWHNKRKAGELATVADELAARTSKILDATS